MRLHRLDLLRYGPFTGRTLRFDPDARVHVVYGPNEAGKSCALAAVTDLFFGFEHKTAYDFLHAQDSLRVGAEIVARDGRTLDFRRRKGRKNTILGANEETLPETSLAPFLGSVTRDVFCHAFGLSTETLRAGGTALEAAGGDIGAQIFAAGSGLKHLVEIRRALDSEAEQIYAPQGRARDLNRVLQRIDQARSDKAKADLLPTRWRHLNEAVDQLDREYKEAREARDRAATEADRLDRLVRAAPIIGELERLAADRAALGSLPVAEPGTAERLSGMISAAALCQEAADRAAVAVEVAERELAAVVVDQAVLDAAAAIDAIVSGIGVYTKSNQDLPKITGELAEARRKLGDLAARLGLASIDALEAARPTDAMLARCRELAHEGRSLREALRGATERLDQDRRALGDRQAELERAGSAVDPAPVLARRATLEPLVKALSERESLSRSLEEELTRVSGMAARLSPGVSTPDALPSLVLPSLETQRRFDGEMTALRAEVQKMQDAIGAAVAETERIDRELAGLLGGPQVVTWAEVTEARLRRDEGWAAFLSHLDKGGQVGSEMADEVRRQYEGGVIEADRLVDAYARDAARSAEVSAKRRQRDEAVAKQLKAEGRLAELSGQWVQVSDNWSKLWAAARIAPLPPTEMMAWTERIQELIRRIEDLIPRRRKVEELDRIIRISEPELRRLGAEVGVGGSAELEIGLVVTRTDALLDELEQAWESRRELAVRIRDRREAVDRSRSEMERARQELEAWESRFDDAGRPLGLTALHGPQETAAVLDAWSSLSDRLLDRERAVERLRDVSEAGRSFERRAEALAAGLAPDIGSQPPDRIAETLRRRLTDARETAIMHDQLRRQRDSAAAERQAALARLAAALAALEGAAGSFGARPGPEFTAWVDRVAAAERLDAAIAERRRELARFIPDEGETAIRAALSGFDLNGARDRIAQLKAEADLLDRRCEQLFSDRARAIEDCDRRRGSTDADLAQQRRIAAEAEARDTARRWLVLRTAYLLIGAAVERQRAERQDPVLARAGSLFRTLTGGSFVDLRPVYGEDDEAQLAGCRADGALVPTSSRAGRPDRAGPRGLNDRSPMSEGTLDQLYLALRLSMLEDFATRSEPPPFLADDLFASFDDQRTEQGLDVLAEVGANIQPILFTHHRHVADIARRRLGAAVDIVELA